MTERYIDFITGQNISGLCDTRSDVFIPDQTYKTRVQLVAESKRSQQAKSLHEYKQGTRLQPELSIHSRPLTANPDYAHLRPNGAEAFTSVDTDVFLHHDE